MRPFAVDQERPDDYVWRWSFLAPKYWGIWLWFALLWLITRMPLGFVRLLGEGVGLLFYKLAKSRRRVSERNLELCFPNLSKTERDKICRESFKGMGCTLFESGFVWWSRPSRLSRLCQFENLDAFEQAEAEGKPLMLVGLHNTCLEMAYAAIVQKSSFNVIYRIHDNPVFEYVSGKGRLRFPLRLIGRKNVRAFISSLENKEVALMVPDQDLGKRRAVFVPFFDIPTVWVTSAADIAHHTNAVVQFVSVRRDWSQKAPYIVTFSDVLDNFPSGDAEADMTYISRLTEETIRRDPSQYLWAHRRFKSRPEGMPDLYKR